MTTDTTETTQTNQTTPDTGNETPNETTTTTADPTSEKKPDPETPDTGNEPDLKAEVDKWKALARRHEQRAKENAAAAKELDKLKEQQLTETERAVKKAREEGLNEGRSIANQRLIRAEVISAAAGKAADPSDVYAILAGTGALSSLEVNDDGEVDTETVTSLVDDLIKAKPHLAAVRSPNFGARAPAQDNKSQVDMDAWIRGQAGR
jgi:hypothetical protein